MRTNKMCGQKRMEINDNNANDELNSSRNSFGTDFMMHPNKFYKFSFVGEQCQFIDNSTRSVVCLEIKMGTAFNYKARQ